MYFNKMILTLLFSFFCLGAFAETSVWDAPLPAAKQNMVVNQRIHNLQLAGYELTDQFENAFIYDQEPEGDFDWGTYEVHLSKTEKGAVTYVTVTVYIRWNERAEGYSITGYDVHEETVF